MKPQVSIIVPVYNTEKYLQDCIDSLMNQTMQEIEIIFINDGSTDHCLRILQINEKMHKPKIKLIDSENLKQGGARNKGLRIAQGDYILFVDSDDFLAPTVCEKMFRKITAQDADVCCINFCRVAEDTEYKAVYSGGGYMKIF